MKLTVIPTDSDILPFEVEVTKEYSQGSNCTYKVKHKEFKGFQFDDSDRPKNYKPEYVETITFHGYMIAKKGFDTIECYIKIKK
jgi:hypothetical protein